MGATRSTYRNIGNLSQVSLKNDLHKYQFYANHKVTITVTKPKLTSTNPKLTRNSNLNQTLLTKDPLTQY